MSNAKTINPKYTWDLRDIYLDFNQFDKDFEEVKKLANQIPYYKGRLNNKEDILNECKLSSVISRKLDKLALYLNLKKEQNGADIETLEKMQEFEIWATEYSALAAFVTVELSKLEDEFIDKLIADPEFSNFDRELMELKEDKKHILDQKSEEMITKMQSFANFSEIYSKLDDIELKFASIKLDNGDEVQITQDNFGLYMSNPSQEVRKNAFNILHEGFKNFNLTISENFISFLKYKDVMAEFRNFKSSIDSALYSSKVDRKVIDKLILHVNNHLNDFYNYTKVLKTATKTKKLYNSDMYAPAVEGLSTTYEYEQGVELVKSALKPLGKNYTQILNTLLNNRSIDVFPAQNKGGGGFSTCCYDVHPYILLSFNGSFREVSTLAHELGHSIHSVYSCKNQVYEKADYEIFVAEIASTVNEILLFKYMEQNAKNEKERKYHIANFLSNFYATVFRQTMFSEFELYVHSFINKKEPLSYAKINDFYGDLQKKYFGTGVELCENAKYEWSRIPHFYRPFYVFKYATGFISACSIVKNILDRGQEYVDNCYIKFLSAGCSEDPLEILKLAEVDILDEKTYDNAFKLYNEYVKEFDRLNKKK